MVDTEVRRWGYCSVLLLSPDDFIRLMRVSVVKHAKQILPWSIDSLAKKVVGEKQTVALVVQFVVTISSGSLESLHSCHVQFHAFQSGKLLVKVPQSLLTDAVCPLPDQSELSKLIYLFNHLLNQQRILRIL